MFQANPTPDLLHRYQTSRDALVALQECVQECGFTMYWQRFTNNINQQTSVTTMWHLIRRVVSNTPATARHHTPDAYDQQLVNTWSEQSTPASLPIHIQDALCSRAPVRRLGLVLTLLQDDSLSLTYYLSRVHSAALPVLCRRDVERPYSIIIFHYTDCRDERRASLHSVGYYVSNYYV